MEGAATLAQTADQTMALEHTQLDFLHVRGRVSFGARCDEPRFHQATIQTISRCDNAPSCRTGSAPDEMGLR